MDKAIRAFIAVELSSAAVEELSSAQARLKTSGAEVKWTDPGCMHLTICFLGNISPSMVSAISGTLSNIAASVPAFKLKLEGIGAYPDRFSPKVIWAGVKDGMDSCKRLSLALKAPLKDLGIVLEDRKFSAHVTLGRVRGANKLDRLRQAIDSEAFSGLSQSNIDRVVLFESRLGPAGPSYTPLFKTRLAPHAP